MEEIGHSSDAMRGRTIVSVGYEGRSATELVDALAAAGVTTLVDVRQRASSRKPGLSKRSLGEQCRAQGIEYVHEPTLGNPRDNRVGFRAGTAASRATYARHLDTQGDEALARVASRMEDGPVALLCFEADPATCHRSVVIENLRRIDPTITVRRG